MHILIVDTDHAATAPMQNSLTQWQHTVATAADGRSALALFDGTRIEMVICSESLPDINGFELCQKVRALSLSHAIYFLLTVNQGMRCHAAQLIQSGADDFITKPVNHDQLQIKLIAASRLNALKQDLDQKLRIIRHNYYQTVSTLTQLIESYSEKVGLHCRRVAKLALSIAKRHPQVGSEDYPLIEAAGMLHDIGLIGLPEPVLSKRRTELNGEESLLYRSHPERGEAILSQMDLLRPVSRWVRMHHEQHNGRGFPDGLPGSQIPLPARIIAAASIYDDLVHRENIDLKSVPEQLQQYRGYQLDPEMVDVLLHANLSMMQAEDQRDDRPVLIADLQDGSVLARDILMKSGAFLMAAATRLDAGLIQKLKRYYELGNIADRVFIRK